MATPCGSSSSLQSSCKSIEKNWSTIEKLLEKSKKWQSKYRNVYMEFGIDDKELNHIFEEQDQYKKELGELKIKLKNCDKKCVIFAKTSVGKSTVINNLLGRDILPTGSGRVSKKIVKIFISSNKTEEIKYGKEKRNTTDLSILNDQIDNLKEPIKVYLQPSKTSAFPDDVTICDTPGICDGKAMEEQVANEFRTAHLIIILLDARCGINSEVKRHLRSFLLNFNVIVIYNKWDLVVKNGEANIKEIYMNDMEKFLKEELNVDISHMDSMVHFISAKMYQDNKEVKCWIESQDLTNKLNSLNIESSDDDLSSVKIYQFGCQIINIFMECLKNYENSMEYIMEMQKSLNEFLSDPKENQYNKKNIKDLLIKKMKETIKKNLNENEYQKSFDTLKMTIKSKLSQNTLTDEAESLTKITDKIKQYSDKLQKAHAAIITQLTKKYSERIKQLEERKMGIRKILENNFDNLMKIKAINLEDTTQDINELSEELTNKIVGEINKCLENVQKEITDNEEKLRTNEDLSYFLHEIYFKYYLNRMRKIHFEEINKAYEEYLQQISVQLNNKQNANKSCKIYKLNGLDISALGRIITFNVGCYYKKSEDYESFFKIILKETLESDLWIEFETNFKNSFENLLEHYKMITSNIIKKMNNENEKLPKKTRVIVKTLNFIKEKCKSIKEWIKIKNGDHKTAEMNSY